MIVFWQETKLKNKSLYFFENIWYKGKITGCSVNADGLSKGFITMWQDELFVEEERLINGNFILLMGCVNSLVIDVVLLTCMH